MTLYDFLLLDEMEQAEAVWEGTLIGDRKDAEHNILLYQIDGFYVEVFYHSVYNVIRGMQAFASTDKLQPYLEQISLSGL